MIHSTITRRITICIFIFGREGSTNIVWKRIYAWTCKFTYKPKKKKKRIVSRVLRERWLSLWPQFLTLNILIQFELPLSFFRWSIPGESRVGYSGRDGWTFGHSFWRYTFWFNLSYHCLFFGDRFQVSREITNPMSRILLTWVSVFFNFFPRRVKATRWGNEITVLQENHGRDRGYLYKTFKENA